MPLGRFTAEGQRLIRKLGDRGAGGWRCSSSYWCLLRVMERGGVKMLEVYTDVFAVPLNPAQVRGKRVVVER